MYIVKFVHVIRNYNKNKIQKSHVSKIKCYSIEFSVKRVHLFKGHT